MHFWPKFGNTDFNWWRLIAWTSSKWGKFWLLSSIWPWSSRSIAPRNNRDPNQGLLHLWSKFGDSSLNSWLVIARTSWWLTDRHTHTHTQATTIPEGHNWPRVKTCIIDLVVCLLSDMSFYCLNTVSQIYYFTMKKILYDNLKCEWYWIHMFHCKKCMVFDITDILVFTCPETSQVTIRQLLLLVVLSSPW